MREDDVPGDSRGGERSGPVIETAKDLKLFTWGLRDFVRGGGGQVPGALLLAAAQNLMRPPAGMDVGVLARERRLFLALLAEDEARRVAAEFKAADQELARERLALERERLASGGAGDAVPPLPEFTERGEDDVDGE